MWGFSIIDRKHIDKSLAKLEKQQQELITIYTPVDIIYLKGTEVTSESGRIILNFDTRIQAINFVEQMTADMANGYDYE